MNNNRPELPRPDDEAALTGADRSRRRRAVQLATAALVNTALATTALLGALEVKLPKAQGD